VREVRFLTVSQRRWCCEKQAGNRTESSTKDLVGYNLPKRWCRRWKVSLICDGIFMWWGQVDSSLGQSATKSGLHAAGCCPLDWMHFGKVQIVRLFLKWLKVGTVVVRSLCFLSRSFIQVDATSTQAWADDIVFTHFL
jgi:hypothetical protein